MVGLEGFPKNASARRFTSHIEALAPLIDAFICACITSEDDAFCK